MLNTTTIITGVLVLVGILLIRFFKNSRKRQLLLVGLLTFIFFVIHYSSVSFAQYQIYSNLMQLLGVTQYNSMLLSITSLAFIGSIAALVYHFISKISLPSDMFKNFMNHTLTIPVSTYGVIQSRLHLSRTEKQLASKMKQFEDNIKSQWLGLSACVYSLTRYRDWKDIAAEGIKIFSMLRVTEQVDLEHLISPPSISKNALNELPVDKKTLVQQNFLSGLVSSPDSAITLLGTGLALGGKQISPDIKLEEFTARAAFNIKNFNTVWKELKSPLLQLGMIKDSSYGHLKDIADELQESKDIYHQVRVAMISNPNSLLIDEGRAKVISLKNKCTDLNNRLSIIDKDLKTDNLYKEVNTLLKDILSCVVKIESMKASSNYRVKPVGVCIKGQGQIGKTTLVPILIRKVGKLLEDRQSFRNSSKWSIWRRSPRDEFDTGYCGQEVTYSDDAFQEKDNKDHLLWYTFISNSAVGTNQANINEKGTPYQSKLVITTCNQFPTQSITVNHISSLHARFPVTVVASLKTGATVPKGDEIDQSYSWVDFKYGTMEQAISGIDNLESVTLDKLVEIIADKLELEEQFFMSTLAVLEETPLVVHSHGDETYDESVVKVSSLEEVYTGFEGKADLPMYTKGNMYDVGPDQTLPRNIMLSIMAHCRHLSKGGFELTDRYDLPNFLFAYSGYDKTLYSFTTLMNKLFNNEQNLSKYNNQILAASPIVFNFRNHKFLWHPGLIKTGYVLEIDDALINWSENFKRNDNEGVAIFLREVRWVRMFKPYPREINFPRKNDIKKLRSKSLILTNADRSAARECYEMDGDDMLDVNDLHHLTREVSERSFEKLDSMLDRLSRSGMTSLLSICSYLGINVNDYWRAILIDKAPTISKVMLTTLTTGMVYFLYSYINKRLNVKQDSISEKHPSLKSKSRIQRLNKRSAEVIQQFYNDKAETEFENGYQPLMVSELTHEINTSAQSSGNVEYVWLEDIIEYKNVPYPDGLTVCVYNNPANKIKVPSNVQKHRVFFEKGTTSTGIVLSMEYEYYGDEDDYRIYLRNVIEKLQSLYPHTYDAYLLNWCVEGDKFYARFTYEFHKGIEDGNSEVKPLTRRLCASIIDKMNVFIKNDCKVEDESPIIVTEPPSCETTAVVPVKQDSGQLTDVMKVIVNKHLVKVASLDIARVQDATNSIMAHGLGYLDKVVFNAHVINSHNYEHPFVKIYKDNNKFKLAKVISVDAIRDIAIAQFVRRAEVDRFTREKYGFLLKLPGFDSNLSVFADLTPYLLTEAQMSIVLSGVSTLHHLPMSNINVIGRTKGRVTRVFSTVVDDKTLDIKRSVITYTIGSSSSVACSKHGDCGGPILVAEGSMVGKLLGFHSLVAKNDLWFSVFLTVEDIALVVSEYSMTVPNDYYTIGVSYDESPVGPCKELIGTFKYRTMSATNTNLNHWRHSPWFDQFEEQLQPGPLSVSDPRIDITKIRLNTHGDPSLLANANEDMVTSLNYTVDKDLLNWIVDAVYDEYKPFFDDVKTLPKDWDLIDEIALNGHYGNKYVTGIKTDAAAGLPWSYEGIVLKSDAIAVDPLTGRRSFKGDEKGIRMQEYFHHKLSCAAHGQRLMSYINSKLKDTTIKKEYVKIGKTRVFNCVPLDIILVESALFGSFKECYTRAYLSCHHAMGTNVHSIHWTMIATELQKHPNYFDADYTNFDKKEHQDFLYAAYKLIKMLRPQDAWSAAVDVCADELINSYMVDGQTVYKVERGNKSGSFLTTVINCIVNDFYVIYAWVKATNMKCLKTMRDNVVDIAFGDDLIISVSDDYREEFNFVSFKQIVEQLGHTITDGSKSKEVQKFTNFEDIWFLKRRFVKSNCFYIAPLLKRSIESPFVWTELLNSQVEIWHNLIEEQLLEASLHGEEYYIEFQNKIKFCSDTQLLRQLESIYCMSYQGACTKYWKRFLTRDE